MPAAAPHHARYTAPSAHESTPVSRQQTRSPRARAHEPCAQAVKTLVEASALRVWSGRAVTTPSERSRGLQSTQTPSTTSQFARDPEPTRHGGRSLATHPCPCHMTRGSSLTPPPLRGISPRGRGPPFRLHPDGPCRRHTHTSTALCSRLDCPVQPRLPCAAASTALRSLNCPVQPRLPCAASTAPPLRRGPRSRARRPRTCVRIRRSGRLQSPAHLPHSTAALRVQAQCRSHRLSS